MPVFVELGWIYKHWPTYRYRSTCGCPILCTVKTGNEAASFINFKPSQEKLGYRDRVHHGAIPTADRKELARVRYLLEGRGA